MSTTTTSAQMNEHELTQYLASVLINHNIEFETEDREVIFYEQGGDANALAKNIMSGDLVNLTINQECDCIGGITMSTEHNNDRGCKTTEIYNYSNACEYLNTDFDNMAAATKKVQGWGADEAKINGADSDS